MKLRFREDILIPLGCGLLPASIVFLLSTTGWTWPTVWSGVDAVGSVAAFAAAAWLVFIAARQMKATERQLPVMDRELHHSRIARLQDNKPTVVLDRRDYPHEGDGNAGWVIANVGRGFAANVFIVNPDDGTWRSLGGLGAGSERPVTHEIDQELRNPLVNGRYILLAEGAASRTRRWNPTLNVLQTDSRFVHLFTYPHGPTDSVQKSHVESKQALEDYLADNRVLLQRQFDGIPRKA